MSRPSITRARPYTPATGLVAGATFTSERQYRNALARARGYASWAARQRAPRTMGSAAQVRRLRPSERLARRQALEALGLMRREGISLSRAAARAETTPAAVLRHAGPALVRSPGGRYRATASDRLYRPLTALTTEGQVGIDVTDSATASRIGSHWAAIDHYLASGHEDRLQPFRGRRIGRYVLETDPDVIDELARRGELSFEDLYQS